MDPIEVAFSIIGIIFMSVYITLFVLLLKNRSEKGKKEFWNLSTQFSYIWLISSELYNENGNHYRKILLTTLLVGVTLFISLMIAAVATSQ